MSLFIRHVTESILTQNYDSLFIPAAERHLTRNLSELWLIVRLAFLPMPAGSMVEVDQTAPPHQQGIKVPSLAWPPAEFEQFKQACKYVCEEVWDNRLFIIVPENAPQLRGGLRRLLIPQQDRVRGYNGATFSAALPAVQCCMEVQIVGENDDPHALFDCYFLPPNTAMRSFVRKDLFIIRFNKIVGDLCQHDAGNTTSVIRSSRNGRPAQYTVAHELGHALGLPHVCGSGNDNEDYGHRKDEAHDIMGGGNRVSYHHTKLWVERMADHTTDDIPWKAVEAPEYLRRMTQRSDDVMRARGRRHDPRGTMYY